MELTFDKIETEEVDLVTDSTKPSYGVGNIDRIKDGLLYVWYDEEAVMVHYKEDQLKTLNRI